MRLVLCGGVSENEINLTVHSKTLAIAYSLVTVEEVLEVVVFVLD